MIIPERYLVLQSAFLSLPWRHYHPRWRHWEDVGINIVGHIPLGFFVVYFSTVHATGHATAVAILVRFLTSLTIEGLQAYLPTRDSGMNDLITNTLGTGFGVLLHRSSLLQNLRRQLFAEKLPA